MKFRAFLAVQNSFKFTFVGCRLNADSKNFIEQYKWGTYICIIHEFRSGLFYNFPSNYGLNVQSTLARSFVRSICGWLGISCNLHIITKFNKGREGKRAGKYDTG